MTGPPFSPQALLAGKCSVTRTQLLDVMRSQLYRTLDQIGNLYPVLRCFSRRRSRERCGLDRLTVVPTVAERAIPTRHRRDGDLIRLVRAETRRSVSVQIVEPAHCFIRVHYAVAAEAIYLQLTPAACQPFRGIPFQAQELQTRR